MISPLLANLYLHWFDKVFHGSEGPFKFANARMVRFGDDFVIMARYVDNRIVKWVENKIETSLGLVINRDKTKVINAKGSGMTIDFLGYSFRYAAIETRKGKPGHGVMPKPKSELFLVYSTTSSGNSVIRRTVSTTVAAMLRFGTKCPSMMSMCNICAPCLFDPVNFAFQIPKIRRKKQRIDQRTLGHQIS